MSVNRCVKGVKQEAWPPRFSHKLKQSNGMKDSLVWNKTFKEHTDRFADAEGYWLPADEAIYSRLNAGLDLRRLAFHLSTHYHKMVRELACEKRFRVGLAAWSCIQK